MATEANISSSASTPSYTSKLPPFPEDVPTAPLVTISLSKLVAKDPEEHASLYSASKSLGFFYLDMQCCADGEALLQDADIMFGLMENFFSLPVEEKEKFDFAGANSYFGYKGMGAEVIDKEGTKDRNEIYNTRLSHQISKDDILSVGPAIPAPDLINTNRRLIQRHMKENYSVLTTLFNSLTTSMGLPEGTFADLHPISAPSGCHVRFIRAPPQPRDDRRIALGEHTDFGSLTILFNRIGGLQVLLPGTRDWVYVRPVPGCAIINLGDAMVKFTAGILRSNLHRVVSPPCAQGEAVRYSLVYFCRPEHEVKLRRLKGGVIDKEGKGGENEEGESSKDWIQRRAMGRKIKFFKGSESWEGAKGTEGARL
ncbi:MAG: hypothetical protein M1830_010483 [Pleopsidium flavum]|nr:MAG: hypothetical protein M1830_010483 [Pleopsidium flavum]